MLAGWGSFASWRDQRQTAKVQILRFRALGQALFRIAPTGWRRATFSRTGLNFHANLREGEQGARGAGQTVIAVGVVTLTIGVLHGINLLEQLLGFRLLGLGFKVSDLVGCALKVEGRALLFLFGEASTAAMPYQYLVPPVPEVSV